MATSKQMTVEKNYKISGRQNSKIDLKIAIFTGYSPGLSQSSAVKVKKCYLPFDVEVDENF